MPILIESSITHLLKAEDGHIWGIDHGLCFHQESKLRTVMWDFAEEPIPALVTEWLDRLRKDGVGYLQGLIDADEMDAIVRRAERLAVSEPIEGSLVVAYLNRLSDLVWTMARWQEGDEHLEARSGTHPTKERT